MLFRSLAPLEKLRADETLRRSLGAEQDTKGATSRPLTDDELREAGLTIADADGERLVFLEVPLLNRVTIRGVVRTVATEHPDGVEVAWGFDPRLREHPRWRATCACGSPSSAQAADRKMPARQPSLAPPAPGQFRGRSRRKIRSSGRPDESRVRCDRLRQPELALPLTTDRSGRRQEPAAQARVKNRHA